MSASVLHNFKSNLPQFIYNDAKIEENPATYNDVVRLLNGESVSELPEHDRNQIINLNNAYNHLIGLLETGQFSLTKEVFTKLNSLVAIEESLEWGVFRGEGRERHLTPSVGLGDRGRHIPIATEKDAPELNRVFDEGVRELEAKEPFERAIEFSLFGAFQQFFFDGNKRTSRLMMNGVLLSNGLDAITIPENRIQEYNERMVRYYVSRDCGEMMEFMKKLAPYEKRVHLTHSGHHEFSPNV